MTIPTPQSDSRPAATKRSKGEDGERKCLQRQLAAAEAEVARWPKWKRDELAAWAARTGGTGKAKGERDERSV